MRLDVLTLFPEMFAGYLGQSLLKLAIQRKLVEVNVVDLREWATDRHRQMDDRPFGGGPGMLLMAPPVVECVEEVQGSGRAPGHLVMLTPSGRKLTQQVVEDLARHERIVLLCGRYEGFDDRVRQILQPDEISIGDFILSGGEVAAMTVIDTVIRLVPGVLGDETSSRQDSFSGPERWLEHEQYTRPREYRGLKVPDVLLSGNHQEIAAWRREQSLKNTRQRRADLLSDEE